MKAIVLVCDRCKTRSPDNLSDDWSWELRDSSGEYFNLCPECWNTYLTFTGEAKT